ncbi:MAG: hypothetical protein K0R61_4924 [Microvirga sp.]|nr:hypothetical protein [Microvirga sp.]
MSGVLAAGETQPGRNIPEELRGLGVLFARLMVGAAMAVFLLALWRSCFLPIGDGAQWLEFLVALAFVAGFSERFARGALEKFGR